MHDSRQKKNEPSLKERTEKWHSTGQCVRQKTARFVLLHQL